MPTPLETVEMLKRSRRAELEAVAAQQREEEQRGAKEKLAVWERDVRSVVTSLGLSWILDFLVEEIPAQYCDSETERLTSLARFRIEGHREISLCLAFDPLGNSWYLEDDGMAWQAATSISYTPTEWFECIADALIAAENEPVPF
jgi:hypothetical protein